MPRKLTASYTCDVCGEEIEKEHVELKTLMQLLSLQHLLSYGFSDPLIFNGKYLCGDCCNKVIKFLKLL